MHSIRILRKVIIVGLDYENQRGYLAVVKTLDKMLHPHARYAKLLCKIRHVNTQCLYSAFIKEFP